MAKSVLRYHYEFHPVGQGLFCSGAVRHGQGGNVFRWVYDCGTASANKQQILTRELDALAMTSDSQTRIDLVAISHFDSDHVNGLVTLLARFKVTDLLLPYAPLWRRLLIAFSEGLSLTEEAFRFYISPVDYLSLDTNHSVSRIVFVVPKGQWRTRSSDFPNEDPNQTHKQFPDHDSDSELEFEKVRLMEEREEVVLTQGTSRVRTLFAPSGRPVRTKFAWEFVPHNEKSIAPRNSKRFRKAVSDRKQVLLSAWHSSDMQNALKELKAVYDKEFGTSAKKKNVISLFLYSGAIQEKPSASFVKICQFRASPPGSKCLRDATIFSQVYFHQSAPAVLYAGDGYLDTESRIKGLCGSLTEMRLQKPKIFQVMHHGASANWRPGVAETLNPSFSVFSSDPSRKRPGHPSPNVVRDFQSHNPLQVDKFRGVRFSGYIK